MHVVDMCVLKLAQQFKRHGIFINIVVDDIYFLDFFIFFM